MKMTKTLQPLKIILLALMTRTGEMMHLWRVGRSPCGLIIVGSLQCHLRIELAQFTNHKGEGPAQQMTKASWQRPAPPVLDQAKDRLVFQQVFFTMFAFSFILHLHFVGGAGSLHRAALAWNAGSIGWSDPCGQDVWGHQVSDGCFASTVNYDETCSNQGNPLCSLEINPQRWQLRVRSCPWLPSLHLSSRAL